MNCIDKGDIVGTLFLDLRKAFDLIDHSILIKKLSIYKLRDSTLNLFSSYILDRHQVMESDTGTTRPAHIKSGVPQGSILGPTLVLMFLNDLHLFMKHCDSDYYADDATVHTHGNTPDVIESKLQQDGNNTNFWCKQNKMEINYDKTTCMIVGTQHRTKNIPPLNICIDGNKIKDVKNRNYLVSTLTKIFAGQIILTTFALISHPKFHY